MSIPEVWIIVSLSVSSFFCLVVLAFLTLLIIKKITKHKGADVKNVRAFQLNSFLNKLKEALTFLGQKRVGALIIIQGDQVLDKYYSTQGVLLDAECSYDLIKNIFYCKKTRMHDGAVIIGPGYRIMRASVILTIPKQKIGKKPSENPKYGVRHHVAEMMTDKTDAVSIVVSEESGDITAFFGKNEVEKVKKQNNENNYKPLVHKMIKWKNDKKWN